MNEENSRNDLWVKLSDVERILNTSCVKSEILKEIRKCAEHGTEAGVVVRMTRDDVDYYPAEKIERFVNGEISKRLSETIMNGFATELRGVYDEEMGQYEFCRKVIVLYLEEK